MELPFAAPLVRLAGFRPHQRVLSLIPASAARTLGVLPLYISNGKLVAAVVDPQDRLSIKRAATLAHLPINPVSASMADLRQAFDQAYPLGNDAYTPPDPAEILYRLGHLTSATVQQAVQINRNGGKTPMQSWLEAGLITDEGQAEAFSWMAYQPHLRASSLKPQPGIGVLIPEETAKAQKVIPLWWMGNSLVVAVPCCEKNSQPPSIPALGDIPVRCVVTTRPSWDKLYRHIYLVGRHTNGLHRDSLSLLQRSGTITNADLLTARAVSANTNTAVEDVLISKGLISARDWMNARSKILNVPPAVLRSTLSLSEFESMFPFTLARALKVAPIRVQSGCIDLAMVDPDREIIRLVEAISGYSVEPFLVDSGELERYFARLSQGYRPEILVTAPDLEDVLLGMGVITRSQVYESSKQPRLPNETLSEAYLRQGIIDEMDLCEALSIQTGIPLVALRHTFFDDQLIRKIPFGLYANHQLMPLVQHGRDIWVASADPLDNAGFIAVEEATGQRVWPLIAPRSVIVAALKHTFDEGMRSVPEQVRTVMQYFVRQQVINQVQASQALEEYSTGDSPLDQAIVNASGLPEETVAETMARYMGLVMVDLDLKEEQVETFDALGQLQIRNRVVDPVNIDAARLIDLDTAMRLSALPIKRVGNEVGVAFASLPLEGSVRLLENILNMKVIPIFASRSSLEHAIQRTIGRQNLGTRMLVAGVITRSQLNDALALSSRSGVRLGKALVNRGYITEAQLYRFLAEQTGLPYSRLDPAGLDRSAALLIDPNLERSFGILPLNVQDGEITLAVVDPLNEEALKAAAELTKSKISPVLVTEADLERALEALYQDEYLNQSVLDLLERAPEDSAFSVLSRVQIVVLILGLIISGIWLWLGYRSYFIFINILSTIFYLSFSAYKFYLIYRAMNSDLEIPVSKAEVAALDNRTLPVYTILVPVYRETEVLPDLIQALTNLDYPATKLDIKILFEADDQDTLEAFKACNPPPQFQAITVPYALPKTKPKACNYGLIHARGDYVVIFDAEDLPDRDQLKKVLVGFSRASEEVVCIQTKLNYYNRSQNLLTRWFTVEYSMWFDLFLPGLDASRAPIPLGGTSNHFKKAALIEAGAWDPFNVTEDADLGVRIFKRGFRTAIVDSTTYEEANSQLYNWIRQRSRWIKGYIQTWLVHMRHPIRLWNEIGPRGFFSFQFVVGGTFFAALMNPIYWALTTIWFLGRWEFVEALYPGIIFFFGSICLYLGNFAFTYMNVAGAMRRGYYDMVKFALLSPLYWGLMSIAAWRGLFQLITKPHFWEKTVHGLTQTEPEPETSFQDQTTHSGPV